MRYCVNVADVGLGGHVVRRYTNKLRRLPGRLGYGAAIVRGFADATYMRYLPMLAAGKVINDARASYRSARSCTIETDVPVPVEIDGEYVGTTPVQAHVVPNALQIRAYRSG